MFTAIYFRKKKGEGLNRQGITFAAIAYFWLMDAAAHLYIWKAIRECKMYPHVTERLYNVLLLIANGHCTTKMIHATTNDLNISPKIMVDIFEVCRELEAMKLINYTRGLLRPYRGHSHGIISCTATGFAYVELIQQKTSKMAGKRLLQKEKVLYANTA